MRCPPPSFRPLRAYAFDPALPISLESAVANEVTLKVPWEEGLRPGPIGSCVEVIDFDPAFDCFYAPVDLNEPAVLGQGGLPPAEGVPQFHQQMAYALVMSTVATFERGLGRVILWSPRTVDSGEGPREQFVPRLRVYPHALSAQQAFYSPSKKALLMGYFPAQPASSSGAAGRATAFTCLSPGVVAHETAHAIFDGLRRRVTREETGAEELAVQEAIADLAGLLQQFAVPGFLRAHVRFTADADVNQRRLEEVARALAQTAGVQAELRAQIGTLAAERRSSPHPQRLKFQERAALVVAAIFEAFVVSWRRRCARWFRIGGLAAYERSSLAGELGGDLIDELSAEANRCASDVLRMCIRAIDYCPPVDVTVVDYLRAVMTADTEVFPDDDRRYRVAIVEAFRRFGLCSSDTAALSPLHLLWRPARIGEISVVDDLAWYPASSRDEEAQDDVVRRDILRTEWLYKEVAKEAAREMGLALDRSAPRTIDRTSDGKPLASVDSCRLATRIGADGRLINEWVIIVTQQRRGYVDPSVQDEQDTGDGTTAERANFTFRGGCTLVVDSATGHARFCVAKDILASNRLARHRESAQQRTSALTTDGGETAASAEPFSVVRGGPVAFE